MLSPRRTAAAVCTVLLLAACGSESDAASDSTGNESSSDSSSSATAGGSATGELDGVSFTGDVGKALKATWTSTIEKPDSTSVTTLVEGKGDAVADGDTISAYLWVGNGSTKKAVFSDYDNGAPESIPNTDQIGEVFTKMFAGATYGSRVAAVTNAEDLFGASAAQNSLGVGADDSIVLVADLVEKAATSPEPTDDQAHDTTQDEMPKVVETDGKPTGLDFSGIDEPALDTPVQRLVLEEGDGAEVKSSDTVTVNYLGATYDAKEPFDESFSGQPLTSPLSGLIQGWSIGLSGVTVGSRVLIQIPPAYGYGSQGSGAIPANATLWFVIDVVSVK